MMINTNRDIETKIFWLSRDIDIKAKFYDGKSFTSGMYRVVPKLSNMGDVFTSIRESVSDEIERITGKVDNY